MRGPIPVGRHPRNTRPMSPAVPAFTSESVLIAMTRGKDPGFPFNPIRGHAIEVPLPEVPQEGFLPLGRSCLSPPPLLQGVLISVLLLEQPLWQRGRGIGARPGGQVTEAHHQHFREGRMGGCWNILGSFFRGHRGRVRNQSRVMFLDRIHGGPVCG